MQLNRYRLFLSRLRSTKQLGFVPDSDRLPYYFIITRLPRFGTSSSLLAAVEPLHIIFTESIITSLSKKAC